MRAVQPIVTNVCGVSLSRGSTLLHCAKTAEQIKMLFGVKTLGGPWDIMLLGGPKTPQLERGLTFKFWDHLVSPEWLKL